MKMHKHILILESIVYDLKFYPELHTSDVCLLHSSGSVHVLHYRKRLPQNVPFKPRDQSLCLTAKTLHMQKNKIIEECHLSNDVRLTASRHFTGLYQAAVVPHHNVAPI